MIDWSASMQQTFEYYTVDENTWKDVERLTKVRSATITRDADADTLGTASFELDDYIQETYVRVYLTCVQQNERERFCLGTFLVQTLPSSFDGKSNTISADAYTPLVELKENPMPLGYSLPRGTNIVDAAYDIIKDWCRAPVLTTAKTDTLTSTFVANSDDTVLKFVISLLKNAKCHLALDDYSRIMIAPDQELDAVTPIWTYTDDNSSILYPDLKRRIDLYGIPNVVEVLHSKNNGFLYSIAINDNPNSPVSTVSRKRRITHRETAPSSYGIMTQSQLDTYTQNLLKSKSKLVSTLSYTHGFCPVNLYDAVRLTYHSAELIDVKARVVLQDITCKSGVRVSETAEYITSLY